MKILVLSIIAICILQAPALASSTTLQVATFNLKWFGLGGDMHNEPEAEFRAQNILNFVEQELSQVDVIVFTEIVNTTLLSQTFSKNYECVSYTGAWSRHQHVVTCYKTDRFKVEKIDNDYIIENVDLGSGGLRPATQVNICHKKGTCFLQVIGVHLAAGNKTAKRIEQIEIIADNLKKLNRKLPTIITGDFNSYYSSQTGLEKNDIVYFEEALSSRTQKFKSITSSIKTYNTGDWARSYDHIIATKDIKVLKTKGYEACKEKPNYSKTFIPYPSFRKYFSDHCPVLAEIKVAN